jgi:hypothetical protein
MNTILQRLGVGALTAAMFFVTGCNSAPVNLGGTPVPNYDASNPRRISASGSGFQLLLFIPIGINGRYEKAWDELEQQAGGDYITDVTVQDSWTYALIGTIYTVKLEANAYPLTSP